MGVFRILVTILLLLGAIIVGLWTYMGGFQKVTVERGAFGPVEIAYTTHEGSYAGLSESWMQFQADWQEAGASDCDSLAVYLNAPGDTAEEDLRSILACRIDTASDADRAALEAAFATFTLPQTDALKASHPFKNQLSFMFAPLRVYPEFEKRKTADGLENTVAYEIYGPTAEPMPEIDFVMPVNTAPDAYQGLNDAFQGAVQRQRCFNGSWAIVAGLAPVENADRGSLRHTSPLRGNVTYGTQPHSAHPGLDPGSQAAMARHVERDPGSSPG